MKKAEVIVNNKQEMDEWLNLHGYPVDDGLEVSRDCRCGETYTEKHFKPATHETITIAICEDCAD